MIVYPLSGHITDSETIFFIGSALKKCTINNLDSKLFANGNFVAVFNLKLGDNLFRCLVDDQISEIIVKRIKTKPLAATHSWRQSEFQSTRLQRICIDAGHGGQAAGTQSPKGIKEKDLNLQIALLLKQELLKRNFDVALTRETDCDLDLQARVDLATQYHSDLFISIHHNAIPDHLQPLEYKGISVHYYYEQSVDIGNKILAALSSATALQSLGLIRQNLHVLRENANCLALLLELGYLIHPEESEIIISSEFQRQVVKAIAESIIG